MGFLKKLFGSGKKEGERVDVNSKNFKYLDDLIHSCVKEIFFGFRYCFRYIGRI